MSAAPVYDQAAITRYAALWQRMTILPSRAAAVQMVAHKIIGYKERYRKIELQTGIPWYFIGVIHYRESDCNFHCHLHNGDPLTARTRQVPKGRPLGEPPFTWEASALDALTMRGLENVHRWTIESFAFQSEGYNGWGYFWKGLTSAYLWGATTDHELGKYTSDHHYDATAPETQIGTMAILLVLMQLDPTISIKSETQSSSLVSSPVDQPATQVAPVSDPTPTPSPWPDQPVAPVPYLTQTASVVARAAPLAAKAKTPWAVVVGLLTSLGSSLGHAVDSLKPILEQPLVVACLVTVAVVSFGVILWEHLRRG